jgi:rod shape-determining protein MreD
MDERTPGIRPRPTLLRQLDAASRACCPATATVALLLIAAGPLDLPGQPELQQAIALGCVFFWSTFRPAAMPPPLVFLLGLLADLLGLGPLGIGVLTLLIVHGVAFRWRRLLSRQGFVLVWLAFVGIAAAAALMVWSLASLLMLRVLPAAPMLFQFALSAGLYPALALGFTWAHRTIAAPERA